MTSQFQDFSTLYPLEGSPFDYPLFDLDVEYPFDLDDFRHSEFDGGSYYPSSHCCEAAEDQMSDMPAHPRSLSETPSDSMCEQNFDENSTMYSSEEEEIIYDSHMHFCLGLQQPYLFHTYEPISSSENPSPTFETSVSQQPSAHKSKVPTKTIKAPRAFPTKKISDAAPKESKRKAAKKSKKESSQEVHDYKISFNEDKIGYCPMWLTEDQYRTHLLQAIVDKSLVRDTFGAEITMEGAFYFSRPESSDERRVAHKGWVNCGRRKEEKGNEPDLRVFYRKSREHENLRKRIFVLYDYPGVLLHHIVRAKRGRITKL